MKKLIIIYILLIIAYIIVSINVYEEEKNEQENVEQIEQDFNAQEERLRILAEENYLLKEQIIEIKTDNDYLRTLVEALSTKGINIIVRHINESEYDLLLRLVEAEAGNQSIDARIAVANVVLNQVNSDLFPNNITQVIYEKAPSGAYHFSVVSDNRINTVTISDETREAVLRAISGEEIISSDVIAFATTNIDFSDWAIKEVIIDDIQFWRLE